ncbi:hypothetical protein FOA52_010562 [Chlamydomonas sp. UWO 241]|nr:hypothetical protein FOA52_010562 [Chlamydomonas sp. UWO 241]
MIAAARLGLSVGSVGHVGSDVYGRYVDEVLQAESVQSAEMVAPTVMGSELDKTLVCFVLVDPSHRHAFCSRYDFGPWPLLQGITSLPPGSGQRLANTKAMWTNGFVFDELPLPIVVSACEQTIASGAAIFFDPGPRCFTMLEGDRRAALDTLLNWSDVVLMTEEEAHTVTGLDDPDAAARWVLDRPGARTEWAIVKLGSRGALLRSRAHGRTYTSPGVPVEVRDTVGCGDSFAAAVVLGFTRRFSIPATLALANAVGAATATGRGAGTNVARAAKVMELLQWGAREHGEAGARDAAREAAGDLEASLSLSAGAARAAA